MNYPPTRLLSSRSVLHGPADRDALENVLPDTLDDGSLCYVIEVHELYILEKFSTDPVSTPNVIATLRGAGSPGRWVMYRGSSQIHDGAWSVSDWYIDGTLGDDDNLGTSISAPIRTGAELYRRLGPYAIWNHSVTVHIGISGMVDALVMQGIVTEPDCHVDVLGTPRLIQNAGSILSHTPVDHLVPAPTLLTTALPDWTPYAGARLRIASGARAGAVAWVAIVSPGGVGNSVIATSQFCRIDEANTRGAFSSVVPEVGDALSVEELPYVPSIRLNIDTVPPEASTRWAARCWSIQHIDCPQIDTRGIAKGSEYSAVYGCRIGIHLEDPLPITCANFPRRGGCNVAYSSPIDNTTSLLHGGYKCCWISSDGNEVLAGNVVYLINCLFTKRLLGNLFSTLYLTACQFFDVPDGHDALGVFGTGIINNVSGTRNAWRGLTFCNGSNVMHMGTINLTGNIGAGRIYQPIIEFSTCAQMLQPDDYAQKGTATLSNGTAEVELLWWRPDIQRLTFSRNTPSGTTGELSAPQASRTTTGFIINSTSPLDNSTVDWQISPLGRDVFVHTYNT